METIRNDDEQYVRSMIAEGERMIGEAKKRDLHLRLLGAIAFQVHCPKFNFLARELSRVLSDVDFAGYSKERNKVAKMMKDLGYADEPGVTAFFGHRRMIFENKSNGLHVDVFFDKLEMNHDIPFTDRLDIDEMTIPLVDMLLEKMQIVQINEKDYVDTVMLLREHSIGNGAHEAIDSSYLAKLLSNDWGFYYTVTTNLSKVREKLAEYQQLAEEDRRDVTDKIRKLLEVIENEPKTLSWKLRARVGPKSKWYREVEEVNR